MSATSLNRRWPFHPHFLSAYSPIMERTLETERLELRMPVATDLAAVATLWKDPALVEFIGRRPLSREQAWQRLQRNVGHWALADYGVFAVIERGGRPVVC